jgi:DNA mismatch repair protein MutS2
MPLFDGVYADIGDQQSIEHSLSTFSSHIHNLNKILKVVTDKSLVLIDELGTSTDPEEGAALAESILDYLRDRGVLTVSTTHHRRVANYVQNQSMMINASVDLDPKTLDPTFYITHGLPGRSYAMTIAERLGLSPDIIHNARLRISSDERDSEELLRELREGKHTVEQLHKEADASLLDARNKQADLDKQLEDVEARKIEIVEEARLELQSRISQVQQNLQRAEKLLSEVENARNSDRNARERVRNEMRLVSDIKQEISEPNWQPIKLDRVDWQNLLKVGDRVFVRGIPRPVEILSVVDEENNIEVLMGTMRAKIPVYQLDKPAEKFNDSADQRRIGSDPRYRQVSGVGVYSRSNIRKIPEDEINLHGQRVDEALANVAQFLDDASLANLDTVRIVHGKGTGTLRQAVREYLEGHSVVMSWESDQGPAGNGVTVVWLK